MVHVAKNDGDPIEQALYHKSDLGQNYSKVLPPLLKFRHPSKHFQLWSHQKN